MAEEQGPIKKSDIIEEDAITAPLELAENFEIADETVNKFVKDAKALGNAVPKSNSLTEMQKVLKQLAEQEKEIVALQTKLNTALKNPAPKEYANKMTQLKAELKAAKGEMLNIAATLGENSVEFQNAARKAGELKDQLDDVADAAKNAAGDTAFERLGAQTGLLGTKLKNLDFKGAAAQIKAISVTSKAMTFKEATDGIGVFGKSLGTLGKALLTNPIFLIATAIALIVVAVVKLKDSIKFLDIAFQALGGVIDFVLQIGKDFLDWIGATSFALEARTDKILKNAEKERDAIKRRYDAEIALASAAGKNTLDLEQEKQQALIKSLSIAVFAIDKEIQSNKTLTDARKKELEEQRKDLFEMLEDASIQYQVAGFKQIDEEKKKNKQLRDEAFALAKFRLTTAIEFNELIAKDANKGQDERNAAVERALQFRTQLADLERKHDLDQEKLHSDQIELIRTQTEVAIIKATQTANAEKDKIAQEEFDKRQKRDADYLTVYKKQVIEEINVRKKAILEEAALFQRGLDAEILAIKQSVIEGTKTKTQGEREITALIKEQSDERVQIEIDAIRQTLNVQNLSVKEREELEKRLYELQTQLVNAYYDQTMDGTKNLLAAITQIYAMFTQSVTALFDSFTQNRLDQLQQEEDANAKQKEQELKAAGDNKQAKEQLDVQYAAKQERLDVQRKESQRKKAQYDKSIALLGAQLALSQAIVEAMTAGPGIGQALAIATAIAGGIQIAAILARKIPSYEKGVHNAPGGRARVSERGTELLVDNGRMFLTPSSESFIDVPAGSDIYPHDQTMRMLSHAGLVETGGTQNGPDVYGMMGRKIDKLTQVIANKPSNEWNIGPRGVERLLRQGDTRIKFLTTTYR